MKFSLVFIMIALPVFAAEITIDASGGRKPISPYIYGRNNSLSDRPGSPTSEDDWDLYREAGVKMFRECGGNNATKYNWRHKLSSHPDWYNNVYSHDWDYAAQSLESNMPGVRGMWAFQLIGFAASNSDNNFDDWGYNHSQWWSGVCQNLAGGGTINLTGGCEATTDGNPYLYLMEWSADSTVWILDRWFGAGGLDLDETMFEYWGMDNEPEIWNGTHDDVMPDQLSATDFMQRYFDVAKKAREKFPEIKLTGPVPCNEWQWYNWSDNKISYQGQSYTWLEYFIKRIGEEQASSGIRLLNVLDVHFYPSETDPEDIVQLHRVWFDTTYDYPGANGVKRSGAGSWDNSITKEYIFKRCSDWLEEHIGPDHGVSFGVSEIGVNSNNPNVIAVWYASNLGVFADNGVEFFTPWYWEVGMWEVLHLFSRFTKENRVLSVSDLEEYVSAYSSINADADSLTVILVNRSIDESLDITVKLNNFEIDEGKHTLLTLNDLPDYETFVSHTDNALVSGKVTASIDSFSISLPSLSVTAVLLSGEGEPSAIDIPPDGTTFDFDNNLNPTLITFNIEDSAEVTLSLYDMIGQRIKVVFSGYLGPGPQQKTLSAEDLPSGIYFYGLKVGNQEVGKKCIVLK
jgi:hypothetical protein